MHMEFWRSKEHVYRSSNAIELKKGCHKMTFDARC